MSNKKSKKTQDYIELSKLTLLAFSSAFFPRVFTSWLGFPSILNLAHLIIVPGVFFLTLIKTKVKDKKQIIIVKELVIALTIFFGVNIASALLNNAGTINAFFNFLLFCEHFLLLVAIVGVSLTPEKCQQFRTYIVLTSFFNLIFAYIQAYVLGMGNPNPDYIQGAFYWSGAGHVVSASVSLTFGIYYLVNITNVPVWLRSIVALVTFWHMNMADAKQVLFVFLVAGGLLVLTKFKRVEEVVKYSAIVVVLGGTLYWAIYNIPALGGFLTWARPEIYGPDGEATLLKTATFRIVPTYYDSPLDPLLGIGPGHTVGRLGGWMLNNYWNLLEPLGATVHQASREVWKAVAQSWLGDQSSMFSPLFGWAGIWGDLGFLGLGSFIYIWYVVWCRLCYDDVSRFFVLTVFVFGLIMSQMEEPGYMLYVAMIIGLRWQEHHTQVDQKKQNKRIYSIPFDRYETHL